MLDGRGKVIERLEPLHDCFRLNQDGHSLPSLTAVSPLPFFHVHDKVETNDVQLPAIVETREQNASENRGGLIGGGLE